MPKYSKLPQWVRQGLSHLGTGAAGIRQETSVVLGLEHGDNSAGGLSEETVATQQMKHLSINP